MSGGRLEALRAGFDAVFAAPHPAPRVPGVPLLLVRAGGEELALRLGELQGLARLTHLVRVPGARAELSGLVSWEGRLVAVFDLAALVGLRGSSATGAALTHLAALRADPSLALAFEGLEGQAELPPATSPGAGLLAPLVIAGRALRLVDTSALLRQLTPSTGPTP